MKPLDFNEEQIVGIIDRVVERTFEMDLTWDWPAGVAFYGVGAAYRATKNERYLTLLKDWIDEYIEYGLPPMSVNAASMGHTLLTLYQETGDESYLELAKKKADYLINDAPRFAEGVLQHTVGGPSIFPEQAWIDTLFMAGYFLVRMGAELNNDTFMQDGLRQFHGHEKYLQDEKTNLYYHGWDNLNGNNMSSVFWARGNAWAAYTMAAIFPMIDVQDPSFMEIHGSLRDQLSALIPLQSENGLWHTILTDPDTYEETSGSAGIAAAIVLNGTRTPKRYRAAQKALNALIEKVDEQGTVRDVSTGTAVMNTTDGYRETSKKRIEGWGQGLALAFFAHVLMKNKKLKETV